MAYRNNDRYPSHYQTYDLSSNKKKKGGLWRVLFIVALLVFIVSAVALGVIAFSYFQGQQKYQGVAEIGNVEDIEGLPVQVSAAEVDKHISVDWKALLAANPDTVAWLYIPETRINYPVVKGTDNEYYLTHDFDGAAGWLANYGAVFMDCKNNPNWTDQLYFLYGHNMNDGSMFTDIAGLADPARFEQCRTIYILSPKGNYKLKTFALDHISAYAEIVTTGFSDEASMNAYTQDKIDNSIVPVSDIASPSSMKKIFAFSTCDNVSDDRFVLFAYVEDSSVDELSGEIGIEANKDNANEFVNDLEINDKRS